MSSITVTVGGSNVSRKTNTTKPLKFSYCKHFVPQGLMSLGKHFPPKIIISFKKISARAQVCKAQGVACFGEGGALTAQAHRPHPPAMGCPQLPPPPHTQGNTQASGSGSCRRLVETQCPLSGLAAAVSKLQISAKLDCRAAEVFKVGVGAEYLQGGSWGEVGGMQEQEQPSRPSFQSPAGLALPLLLRKPSPLPTPMGPIAPGRKSGPGMVVWA